ncbi:DUF1446-domain-containing protein [Thozetella sp. PMI_491]|nr:DUF1446-domain-containing protein [Thozetella sp. PMI_491]
MPVARVQEDGTFFVECHSPTGRGGAVTVDTCRSQLLYELQGRRYYNSDVVALVDQIRLEQSGPDSVFVHGIGFDRPPPTTKVGIAAAGGFQAEVHYYLTGLDVVEKAALLERQLRCYLNTDSFSLLKFTVSGTTEANPRSQDAATVDLRIFAQAPKESALDRREFLDKCWNIVMSTYPGATFAVDNRQGLPRPYNEYFVTILSLSKVNHVAHIPSRDLSIPIPPPEDTEPYVHQQEVSACVDPAPLDTFGETVDAPLGYVVHARSGDRGSDCNIGFFVRHSDEWPWLRSFLSTEKVAELLQGEYNGKRIERFELPHIQAVHFLLKDHLDRGVASSSTYDVLGKNVAEYLRARHVPVPKMFLDRGKIYKGT